MKRMLSVILVTAAIVYAAICVGLYLFQRSLIYFPTTRMLGPTQSAATFDRGVVSLQLTVHPRPGPGAVLYFGGNGEDVSGSLGPLMAAYPDREIVMLHYRGYGGSTGRPTEQALADDAAALFDKVHAEHPDVVVVGRSLGTGVALRLASTRPVSRLVLVTPYDSLMEIAAGQFRMFPVRLLIVDKFESWRYVPKVTAPTLILAAERDEVIPASSSERLRTRFAPGQVSYTVIARASHNTISDDPGYVRALASVLAASAGSAPPSAAR